MMDQEIELIAFAALEWATGRQRIARSQILNDAANTDLCKQSDEHTHGERLEYRHGHGEPEVVCSHCGSPVGIDANTITEFRTHVKPQTPDTGGQPVVADGGTEEEVIGYRVGGPTRKRPVKGRGKGRELEGKSIRFGGERDWCPACQTEEPEGECSHPEYESHPVVAGVPEGVSDMQLSTGSSSRYRGNGEVPIEYHDTEQYYREQIEEWVALNGEPEGPAGVLGEIGAPPEYRYLVEEVVSGSGVSACSVEPIRGPEREGGEARYQLTEIEHPDGSREEASNAGGGASFTVTEQPEEHLLQETRLQHCEFRGWSDNGERLYDGPHIVCADDSERFVTFSPVTAARWLVGRGYRLPWHAEMALSFELPNGEPPPEFSEPESEPPRTPP